MAFDGGWDSQNSLAINRNSKKITKFLDSDKEKYFSIEYLEKTIARKNVGLKILRISLNHTSFTSFSCSSSS